MTNDNVTLDDAINKILEIINKKDTFEIAKNALRFKDKKCRDVSYINTLLMRILYDPSIKENTETSSTNSKKQKNTKTNLTNLKKQENINTNSNNLQKQKSVNDELNNYKKFNKIMCNLSDYDKSVASMIISQIFTIMTADTMERFDIYDFDQLWNPAKDTPNIHERINYMHCEFLYSFVYKFFKDAQEDPEQAKEFLKNMKKINNFKEFERNYLKDFDTYFEQNLKNKINKTNISENNKQELLYKYNVNNMKNNKETVITVIKEYNFAVGLIKKLELLKVLPKIPLIINKLFENKVKVKEK